MKNKWFKFQILEYDPVLLYINIIDLYLHFYVIKRTFLFEFLIV